MKIQEDLKKFNKLKAILLKINQSHLDVGFFGGEKEEKPQGKNELNTPTIAFLNEFGSMCGNIPARPFFRQTLSQNKHFESDIKTLVSDMLDFKITLKSGYRKVGVKIQGELQAQFTKGSFVKNSKATIKAKGSSRPLIDSGQLRRAVSWRIGGNL